MAGSEQERSEVVGRLREAVRLLRTGIKPDLIPCGGIRIAYAMRGARTPDNIAEVTTDVGKDGRTISSSDPIIFGQEAAIAYIVLTALKFDPAIRSAARIGYSERIFEAVSELVFEPVRLYQKTSPAGTGLIDWQLASCCSDGIPDAVAYIGISPETSVVFLFGEDPVRIASNIIILSNRIG